MHDLALRAGALVLFLAILAGGVYAAQEAFGDGGAGPAAGLRLSAPELAKSAAPGTLVSFPVAVRNGGGEAVEVHLASPGDGLPPASAVPATLRVPAGGAAGGFVTFHLPADAPEGPLRLVVQALVDGKPRATLPLALDVARPPAPAREGDAVQVDYVGRFANGTLFDTSIRAVGEGPFPKPDDFRRPFSPLGVTLGPEARTIDGFWRGLVGMGEGQSKTLVLPPWEAFGNATLRQDVPRTTELARMSQPFPRVQTFPRQLLAQFLNESSQEGDLLRVPDPSGNARTYRISDLDAANATIVWQVQPGDRFTVYPVWPNQSFAATVTSETVVFETTPERPDEPLTFYSFAPNASRLRSVNATALVIEHTPEVGLTFTPPGGSQPVRVVEVTPAAFVLEGPNTDPRNQQLIGQTLTFDVTVRQVQRGAGA